MEDFNMKKANFTKLMGILVCFLLVCSVLASCGASNGAMMDEAVGGDKGEDMDVLDKEFSGSTMNPGNKNEMADNSDASTGDKEYEPKIIKTATVSAETKDFVSAIKQIEGNVKKVGGYIEECNVEDRSAYVSDTGSTTLKYARYVLRIPEARLDEFLSEAGELLNILSETTTATDVSDKYYDIEARISVLETERAVLEKMLSEATSVSQMIEIEQRLYDVIYEIESYKTALKVYDSKVAYSTVNLTVNEVADLTPTEVDDSFGTRFKMAVKESWDGFVEFCQDFVIFVVYAVPVVAVLAVPTGIIAVVVITVVSVIVKKTKRRNGADK